MCFARKKMLSQPPDDIHIDGIAQRLKSTSLCIRQVFEFSHALEPAALTDCHVTPLPANHRNLTRRHSHERGRRRWTLDADTRCPELNDILPHVSFFAFTVPLKLLEARSKIPDRRQPVVNPSPVPLIKVSVLPNEIDLPFWKSLAATTGVGRQCIHQL